MLILPPSSQLRLKGRREKGKENCVDCAISAESLLFLPSNIFEDLGDLGTIGRGSVLRPNLHKT